MNKSKIFLWLFFTVMGFGVGVILGRNWPYIGRSQNGPSSSSTGCDTVDTLEIIEEVPTLCITKSGYVLDWSLAFMGKDRAKTEQDTRAFLRKLRKGGETPLILDVSSQLTVADLRRVINVINEDGYKRVQIVGLLSGNIQQRGQEDFQSGTDCQGDKWDGARRGTSPDSASKVKIDHGLPPSIH